ncbi:MAG TPA: DUF3857 domain-containing protein [Sediminibacterium sp.]|nr:DUF3857 domain-containing protein [Sediminibacterium sp.]
MKSLVTLMLTMSFVVSFSQTKSIPKFGVVKPEDFSIQSILLDSSTSVVVLFEVGSSDFIGNNDGDFSLVFKRRQRMLIKKRTGFDDATIQIALYSGGNSSSTEMLSDFRAATYYLENGKVNEVKLSQKDLLTEKESSSITNKKFTFPALTEGCIIDFEYTIKSPYYSRLKSWAFQSENPVLWSQYTVSIPPIFDYLITKKGYLPFTVNSGSTKFKNYVIKFPSKNPSDLPEYVNLSGEDVVNTWAIENVPAFKAENYTFTSFNHLTRIQFHLRSINYSETNRKQVIKDWNSTTYDLLQDEFFAKTINEPNEWMKDDLDMLSHIDPIQKAKNIFTYIRDNFSCNDYDNKWLTQTLRKTFQTKVGSVGDVNLLLCAMLRKAGVEAVPIILSTTDNGKIDERIALLTQYNYVITRTKIGGNFYYLDASRPYLGFAMLAPDCYNGQARVIQQNPESVDFITNSISDANFTSVLLKNDSGGTISGQYNNTLGKFSSMTLRDKLLKKSKEEVNKHVTQGFSQSFNFSNIKIDSLQQFDFPLSIQFDLKIKAEDSDQDIIYFNPMLAEGYKKNPFSLTQRQHPVEMPYRLNETYKLTMDIPKGYSVDELPKSTKVLFNENEGGFEYVIVKNEDKIILQSKIYFNKAIFPPKDYDVLRNFFGVIVKKHSEQIVFKKN